MEPIQRSFSQKFDGLQPECYSFVQNYKLKRLISNPFEIRYLARDTWNDAKRIIRKIKNTLNEDALRRTLQETIVYKRIKCDNLIHGVLDYFIENKELYIVINYYDEENNLTNFISNENIEVINQMIVNWCLDLAFAVDYLHTHDVPHGKINLENVYVNENNRLELGEMSFTHEKVDSTEKNSKKSDISSLVDLISYLTKLDDCQVINDELLGNLKNENSRTLLKKLINLKKNPHSFVVNKP